MKIRISLLASILFAVLFLFAGNALADKGGHSGKDEGAKHEKQEEGSGSSEMDSQGEKKGHDESAEYTKEEGSSDGKGKSDDAPGQKKQEGS